MAPLGEERKKEEHGEECHLWPQEGDKAGEQAGGEEGFCGGLRAGGGEDGKEGEARGGERLHSGENPAAGVGVGYDEEQAGGWEECCVGAGGEKRVGEAAGEGVAAGETEGRAEEGEDFSGDEPVGDEGVHCGEQEDPEGRGVSGDDATVECEAAASGEAAGELEMDECIIFPVVPGVDEPVEAPEEGESEDKHGRDAGLRGRAVLRGHRLGVDYNGAG